MRPRPQSSSRPPARAPGHRPTRFRAAQPPPASSPELSAPRVGLARALSKLGYCSRREAWALIESGAVRVDGRVIRDPEHGVRWASARLEVHGQPVQAHARVYLMLNKPRGLVTTAADERGRSTVFACLTDPALPYLSPVGRLDKASEGLLLLTNDTAWADRITSPESHLEKTYHVQINGLADEALLRQLRSGVEDGGDLLKASRVAELRQGDKNSWLEIVLDEGRNRHIRRMLAAVDREVLRLVRVAVGPLPLGNLAKGQWRHLSPDEVRALSSGRAAPA